MATSTQTSRYESHDLELARSQVFEQLWGRSLGIGLPGELVADAPNAGRGERRLAGGDPPHTLHQLRRLDVPDQESAGAGTQRGEDLLVVLGFAKHQHTHRRAPPSLLPPASARANEDPTAPSAFAGANEHGVPIAGNCDLGAEACPQGRVRLLFSGNQLGPLLHPRRADAVNTHGRSDSIVIGLAPNYSGLAVGRDGDAAAELAGQAPGVAVSLA